MAVNPGVWGIDVGQCGLKAVKLRPAEDGKVELAAFDFIEHAKILSQPEADPDEIIKAALEKFVSRNEWQKDQFVIGVPGQQTFARFCKLPPVEPKKLPDLVRFEAAQQIPFSMDEVVWDFQVFQAKDSPDVEVGIFAMRKDLIRKYLNHFQQLGVAPVAIQTIPSALYNFAKWDAQGAGDAGATVVVDVGAQNTDLIVVEADSTWYRNIPLGGNTFTEALVKAFKLSFSKAENLKRTAAESKYARQVFQAMRPVFSELVGEIQRSLGFYSSTHRDVHLKHVLACGNAFRLTGLQKYLENNLSLEGGVSSLEKFNKLVTNATANAPQFAENVLSFGPAFGLAIQGLGLSPIHANLLPPELARVAMWNRKRPWFIAAAACFAGAAAMPWLRLSLDKQALGSSFDDNLGETKKFVTQAQEYQRLFNEAQQSSGGEKNKLDKLFELQKDRSLVPLIMNLVHQALPEPDPTTLAIRTPEDFKKKIASNPKYARTNRREMLVNSLTVKFVKNIDEFQAPDAGGAAGMPTFGPQAGGMRSVGETMSDFEGGGGGRMRGPAAPIEAAVSSGGDSGAATAPGFFIQIQGRLLYGADQSQAFEYIDKVLYENFRKVFKQPGLGFYLPEEDPKNTVDKKNLRNVVPISVQSMLPASAMVAARPARPGETEQAAVALDPDPLTGEERATDWNITIGFKVKMGEAPPPADANAAAPATPKNP
ncbi:MAG: type IV pilus assembly protein PilM [Planctomycetes bacterium]|nr:type IV pilus assembly protein PilM [Planctomycetota bacterium]